MPTKTVCETIWAHGHPNISARHPTTLMFTKEAHLSKKGDCIVAVAADKGPTDLCSEFKNTLRQTNTKLEIIIETGNVKEYLNASGTPNLMLTHPTDMVIRRSNFTCNRTLAIQSDKAANDISKELVTKLKDPTQQIQILLIAKASHS